MKSLYDRLKSMSFSNGVKLFLMCIVVLSLSYFYLSYFRYHFYALLADEGYMFYEAKRIMAGQIMYKDFFQLLPPGDFFLLALLFKLFGYSYTVGMEAAVIIDSLINTLLFYLGYRAIRSWHAILLPLFFPIPGFLNFMQYSHYWSSMLFLFIALALFMSYLDQHENRYIYLTGIFIGITWLFLPTTGTYAALLFSVVFILEKKKEKEFSKHIVSFWVSMSIPLIITFGYLALQGTFLDFIKEYSFGISVYSKGCTINPISLFFSGRGYPLYPYSLLFISFTGIAMVSGIGVIFFRRRLSNPVKVIFMGDIIQVLSSSSRMDFDHILINSALSLVVILLLVKWVIEHTKNISEGLYRLPRYLFGAITLTGAVWCILIMYSNIINRYERAYTIDFNGTHLWTYDKQQVWDINQFFPTAEKQLDGDKNVFVYPYCPLVYVLYGFNNPTSMDFMFANPLLSAMPNDGPYGYNRIVQELKKANTQYVIYCNFPQDYINFELGLDYKHDRANAVDEFISSQYIPVLKVDQLVLYKKVKLK